MNENNSENYTKVMNIFRGHIAKAIDEANLIDLDYKDRWQSILVACMMVLEYVNDNVEKDYRKVLLSSFSDLLYLLIRGPDGKNINKYWFGSPDDRSKK